MIDELRRAARSLRSHHRLAAMTLLSIALGVSASTGVGSLLYGIVIRPLPYPEADRLIEVWDRWDDTPQAPLTAPEVFALRDESTTLASVAAYVHDRLSLTEREPRQLSVLAASAGIFDVLGTSVARGRSFTPADDRPGAPPVALLSHRLWQSRYGGDAAILGRTIDCEGVLREVIGILPPGLRVPRAYANEPRAAAGAARNRFRVARWRHARSRAESTPVRCRTDRSGRSAGDQRLRRGLARLSRAPDRPGGKAVSSRAVEERLRRNRDRRKQNLRAGTDRLWEPVGFSSAPCQEHCPRKVSPEAPASRPPETCPLVSGTAEPPCDEVPNLTRVVGTRDAELLVEDPRV